MVGGKLMFGHQDEQQTLNEQAIAAQPDPSSDWTSDQSTQDNSSDSSTTTTSTDDTSQTSTINQTDDNQRQDDSSLSSNNNNYQALPANTTDEDLLTIKQQALGQLTPIVGHLDQTPEEKFRTTMMMIQASDDQSLIKNAYEAAQQIQDEKVKAQALLDVVNEINYFTHPAKD